MVHEPDLLLGGKAIEDCHVSGVDPEDALHRACDKYQTRFRRVADAADKPLSDYTETEKIALWKQAKNESSSLTR